MELCISSHESDKICLQVQWKQDKPNKLFVANSEAEKTCKQAAHIVPLPSSMFLISTSHNLLWSRAWSTHLGLCCWTSLRTTSNVKQPLFHCYLSFTRAEASIEEFGEHCGHMLNQAKQHCSPQKGEHGGGVLQLEESNTLHHIFSKQQCSIGLASSNESHAATQAC